MLDKIIQFILNLLKHYQNNIPIQPKNDIKTKDDRIQNTAIAEEIKPPINTNTINSAVEINFQKGIQNLATDKNTLEMRKMINYEFKFPGDSEYKTTWLQCTEYVQYKVLKELGIKIDWSGRDRPRDGVAWPEIFIKLGRYKVLDKPVKGCAMSFAAGCTVPPGHVAFIEEVHEDGSIRITEANWGNPTRGQYNDRPLTQYEWQEIYKGRFIDFA